MGQWFSDRADDMESFLFPQREFMLLIWGQKQSGKSTLSDLFKKYHKPIKNNELKLKNKAKIQTVISGEVYYEVYDFSNEQKENWKEVSSYDAFIFVLDSLDNLEVIKNEFYSMIEMDNFKITKKDKEIPFLFYLNKQDNENKISKEDVMKIFNFEENLKNKKWNIFECSFKNEENVKEGIKWMHDVMYPPLPWWLEKLAFIELETVKK
eukprot:gene2901-4744_t